MLSPINVGESFWYKKTSYTKRIAGYLVPLTGVEPVRRIRARDFKSLVSAYSTTAAYALLNSA